MTNHNQTELAKCPFCGGTPILHEHEAHAHSDALKALVPGIPDHPGSWTIECCDVGMIKDARAEVIAAWNRRTTAAPVEAPGDARKGCRDAFNLISNCRKLMAEKQMDRASNWVIACELFAVGSTTAMAICREADIDPHAYTMGKLTAIEARIQSQREDA